MHELAIGEKESLRDACVCIGVFDGYHLGHKSLVEACFVDASRRCAKSVILTFDKDPDEVFSLNLEKIMQNDQRIDFLRGIDKGEVLAIDFTEEVSSLDPLDFLDMFFGDNLPASIHVGSDFRFGKNGSGDTVLLQKWCDAHGVDFYSHEILNMDGSPVKSTRIRKLLCDGDVKEANRLLGHPYIVCGRVAHGRGEGKAFGFATANVEASCMLGDGVYAGYAHIGDETHKAAISVGIPPTFEDVSKDALEVHVLDYSGDLYEKVLCVSFIEKIRPMIKFDSTDALISQVKSDIRFVRENL